MKSPTLLIYTNKADPHADEVIRILNANGNVEPIRLNSNDFYSNCRYSFQWGMDGRPSLANLEISDSSLSIDRVDVAWWRKPSPLQPPSELTFPEAAKMSVREGNALLRSLDAPFQSVAWINEPNAMYSASPKLNQFRVANAFGLSIPETLVTNQGSAILEFMKGYSPCIVKSLAGGAFQYDGKSWGVFTSRITMSQVEELLDSVQYAPVMVQREVEKNAELRITIIGDNVFACEIEAAGTEFEDVRTDWRIIEPERLPHRIVEIPDTLRKALQNMLRHYHLRYGAFDIIQESSGQYYFLELNPNGQYLWIEHNTGAPLSRAMADLVESLAPRA